MILDVTSKHSRMSLHSGRNEGLTLFVVKFMNLIAGDAESNKQLTFVIFNKWTTVTGLFDGKIRHCEIMVLATQKMKCLKNGILYKMFCKISDLKNLRCLDKRFFPQP